MFDNPVEALKRSDKKVDALESAPHQLNLGYHNIEKNDSLSGFPTDSASGQTVELVEAFEAFFGMGELARLAEVSLQAIHKAIQDKSLEAQQTVSQSGRNKGRKMWLIPHTAAFVRYPKAREAYEAANLQTINENEIEKAEQEARSADAAAVAQLKDWERRDMDARLIVLDYLKILESELNALHGWKSTHKNKAIEVLCARSMENRLPENIQAAIRQGNARRGKRVGVCSRTIKYWISEAKNGNAALAPKVKPFREPNWLQYFLQHYQRPQKPAIAQAMRDMEKDLPPDVQRPSYAQVCRLLKEIDVVALNKGRMLGREIKNIMGFRRRDTFALGAPLVLVIADGHTFGAEVQHPFNGRPFRPELTTAMCCYTRVIVGYGVSLKENAQAVMETYGMVAVTRGVPAGFYSDNGPGYVNAQFEGVCARVGTTIHHSIPYNSQSRGLIERVQKTVWEAGAKKFPTYIGKSMDKQAKQMAYKDTRKGKVGVLPTWAEFVEFVQQAVEDYNNRPHTALPMRWIDGKRRHLSPNEFWQESVDAGWKPEKFDPAFYDELLPCEEPTVFRCEVKCAGHTYYNDALKPFNKDKVRVHFNPWDARQVWVRTLEGVRICVAEVDGNKSDYMPESKVQQDLATRQRGRERRALNKIAMKRDIDLTGLSDDDAKGVISVELSEPPDKYETPLTAEVMESAKAVLDYAPSQTPLQEYLDLIRLAMPTEEQQAIIRAYEATDEGKAVRDFVNPNRLAY